MSPQRERIPSEGATRSRTNLAIRDYVHVSSAMWSRMAFLCRGTHRTTARRENVPNGWICAAAINFSNGVTETTLLDKGPWLRVDKRCSRLKNIFDKFRLQPDPNLLKPGQGRPILRTRRLNCATVRKPLRPSLRWPTVFRIGIRHSQTC